MSTIRNETELFGNCYSAVVQLGSVSSPLAKHRPDKPVQQLGWRGLAVRKNCGYRRRKLINSRARHDDAVSATMSFFGDTQEFTALVLPELDIKVLALNLQFFRLDDVIHFALRTPSLGSGTLKWKQNPRAF
jgi:hypothetical protein